MKPLLDEILILPHYLFNGCSLRPLRGELRRSFVVKVNFQPFDSEALSHLCRPIQPRPLTFFDCVTIRGVTRAINFHAAIKRGLRELTFSGIGILVPDILA
jgi:hypothetical protein